MGLYWQKLDDGWQNGVMGDKKWDDDWQKMGCWVASLAEDWVANQHIAEGGNSYWHQAVPSTVT